MDVVDCWLGEMQLRKPRGARQAVAVCREINIWTPKYATTVLPNSPGARSVLSLRFALRKSPQGQPCPPWDRDAVCVWLPWHQVGSRSKAEIPCQDILANLE